MTCLKLCKIVVLGMLLLLLSHCSEKNPILNPNSSDLRNPLFSIKGVTSHSTPMENSAKMAKLLWNETDPLTLISESKNPKILLLWVNKDPNTPDSQIVQVEPVTLKWPLDIHVNFYTVPENHYLSQVPNHPSSYYGLAKIMIFNDHNNNDKLDDFSDERYFRLASHTDSLINLGIPFSSEDSAMLDTVDNYAFMRLPEKDWLLGMAKVHTLLYCSDSVAVAYIKEKLDNRTMQEGEFPGVYNWTGFRAGYNLMETKGISTMSLSVPPFLGSVPAIVGCDSLARVDGGTAVVDFGVVSSQKEMMWLMLTEAFGPWEFPDN